MITALLLEIKDDLEDNVTLTDDIYIDNLPDAGGISMQIDNPAVIAKDMKKQSQQSLDLTFFRKSTDQALCISELEAIGKYMTKTADYDTVDGYKIYSIDCSISPTKVTKELDGNYIYALVCEVKFYG